MNPNSTNSQIFHSIKFIFLAPKFIIEEFNKHQKECLTKSKLNKKEFNKRKQKIFSKIIFIEFNYYKDNLKEAITLTPDKDDAPSLALAIKEKCAIWSNDSHLKTQNKVVVFNTKQILTIF